MVRWIESGGRARQIAAVYLGFVFLALLGYGWATSWLPWSRECSETISCHLMPGETYGAIEQAWGTLSFGLGKSWLLYIHRKAGEYEFYIHNQNFGAYLVYFTALLGADTIMPAGIVTAGGFIIGLAYAYLLVERISHSPFMALIFLTLLILDVYMNTMLGLNLLRAWHWLPLFGLAYHALSLFRAPRVRARDVGAVLLLALLGFALGYEFYSFVIATAVLALLFSGFIRPVWRWYLFGGLLFLPMVIRQIQVMGGVGISVWFLDLYYTAGTKSPLLRNLMPHPPVEDVLAWYEQQHLFHGVPNNEPISAAFALFVEKQYYLRWLDDLGPLTIAVAFIGLVVAALVVWRGNSADARCARALLVVAGGQLLGFLIFGYHALLYFLVMFSMPLLVTSVHLSAAFLLTVLVRNARRPFLHEAGLITAVALLTERLYVGWVHLSTMEIGVRPARFEHIEIDEFIDPGGLYGSAGWVVLALATLVYAWVLWRLLCVFLRHRSDRAVVVDRRSSPRVAVPATATAAQ